MELGTFSVSLNVADLAASQAFYETLGFEALGGAPGVYVMMRNPGGVVLGLFQAMFERNILTFNPGWNADATPVDGPFSDVRELRQRLADAGLEIGSDTTADSDAGPASFVVVDPDGNPILIDQHR